MAAEPVPLFGQDFDCFLSYLRTEEEPTIISPIRFGLALRVDPHELASCARAHINTLLRAPATESVQIYLSDSIRTLRAGSALSGDVERTMFWYKNSRISIFDYKTPQTLVSEGRAEDVLRYVQAIEAGFAG